MYRQTVNRIVALYREALESSLIERTVSYGPVRDSPRHGVGVRQPTEEGHDLAVGLRPDGEVPMVGQDTVGEDGDGVPLVGFEQDPLEGLEVGVLGEEVHPADRSVQDVVDQPDG